jgi:hypothetical protein
MNIIKNHAISMYSSQGGPSVSKNAPVNNLTYNIKPATNEFNAAKLQVRSMVASSDNSFTKNYYASIPLLGFIAKTVIVFGKLISFAKFNFCFYFRFI